MIVVEGGTRKMVRLMMPLWVLTLIMLCAGPALAEQAFYRFGVVPQFEPRKLVAIWLPIIAELEKRTGFKLAMV